MKWTIVGLLVLGVVAAISASILVGALRANRGTAAGETAPADVTVLVAARDLPAGAIIDAEDIVARTVADADKPEAFLSDPAQVVGKVLTVPAVEGQAFHQDAFAKEGTGFHLASTIPDGMRAVSIALDESSSLFGLLYPGCTVDVLVAFRSGRGADFASRTLLEGVRVIGIERETVVDPEGEGGEQGEPSTLKRRRNRVVTLLLSPEEAEVLRSAMEQGEISLAMRNPLDHERTRQASAGPVTGETTRPTVGPRYWELTILRNRERQTMKFPYATGRLEQ